MSRPHVNIIIPLYNEEEVFEELVNRLDKVILEFPKTIEVILIDDGSQDDTPDLIKALALKNENYQGIFLSRNFGHQLALTAGLSEANATEGVMVLDGDLQDPPELLQDFHNEFKAGFDVVYGVREIRIDEGLFKKKSSYYFYRILKRLTQIDIPLDSGDFCFMSSRVVKVLNQMPEEKRFIRGMRSWVGFNQTELSYKRAPRAAGETKYSIKEMTKLAFNAIYSFSDIPVKLMTRTGLLIILASIAYLLYSLFKKYFVGGVASGFSGLLFSMILLSGVQLLSLGVLGEYIVRTFFQVKDRPLFIVKEKIKDRNLIE